LFRITNVGEHVVIGNHRIAPTPITHPILFQLLPPIPQTEMSSDGLESQTLDSREPAQPAEANGLTEQTADDLAASERTESAPRGVEDGSKARDRSSAPLRILVTRRTQRDRIISVQHTLSAMGHLKHQKFTGRLGKETIAAIKAFQKANGLRETGQFDNELAKKIYTVAGKAEPPEGHLFVRQNFRPLFDVAIDFRDPEQTLGTHVFIALDFAPGDTTTRWMSMSLERDDAAAVLDRIHIPDDMRHKISERLTPGSSLIIGDKSLNSAILPDGADFLVVTKDSPAVAAKPPAKVKQAQLKKARSKPAKWRRSPRTYAYDYPGRFDRPRLFRWRRR
jgi:peptidoglycan hydrolase-like protein with peptidoglycan-binding domain